LQFFPALTAAQNLRGRLKTSGGVVKKFFTLRD
jgi:hypothetical protein